MSGILGIWRTSLLLVVLACLGLACSGSTDDELLEAPTSTAEATTTSAAAEQTTTTEATTSTLSPAQQEEADARSEIEQVVTLWLTYPFDSSKGEDGLPLEHTTGLLRERSLSNLQQLEQDDQIQRTRGNDQVAVLSIELDAGMDNADVEICAVGDHEFVEAETGEVAFVDEPRPAMGLAIMSLTADGWKVADYFTSLTTENPEFCTLPEAS